MGFLKDHYRRTFEVKLNWFSPVAEMFGVALFVLMGTGAAVFCNTAFYHPSPADDPTNQAVLGEMLKQIIVGAGFGLGIMIAIYAIGHHEAGHLNPAVTIGLVCAGAFPVAQAVIMIAAQVCGALIAAGFLKLMIPQSIEDDTNLGANAVPDGFSIGQAFTAEALATFFAMYVILETVVHPKQTAGSMAPLVIGSTFGILLTVLSPVSSGSFNPARSLGPATVSGQTDDLWIWIFGPILGALLAVPLHLVSVYRAHSLAQLPMGEGIKDTGKLRPDHGNTV